jgi:hypothetical protein
MVADDLRIAAEPLLPVLVTDHERGRRPHDVVLGLQQSSSRGTRAEHVEEAAAHDHAAERQCAVAVDERALRRPPMRVAADAP